MDAKRTAADASVFLYIALKARAWPEAAVADAAKLHAAVAGLIREGRVLAAHDCGEEGWLTALAEMAFAGACGVAVQPNAETPDPFADVPCGYMLQVNAGNVAAVRRIAEQLTAVIVAEVARPQAEPVLSIGAEKVELAALSEAWRSPLRW